MNEVEYASPVFVLNYSRTLPSLGFRSGFFAFRKSVAPEESPDTVVQLKDNDSDFNGIRCPLCAWQPQASSRWYCTSYDHPEYFSNGCGTVWNTFTTRGLCPGCGHQWRWTACLRCHGWSLHEAWYVTE